MPHVIVKLWPGRDEEVKTKLAKRIADSVAEELKADIGTVSVAIQEVPSEEWGEKVYKAEIKDNPDIYQKPSYDYD